MDVIQVLLLAVATFIFAIDQFSFTEVIYRPVIACPIVGLILGDLQTGLIIGGTYELIMIGNMPVGGAQPPNVVIGSIIAMIFAVKSGLDVNAALGSSVIFAIFGQYIIITTFTLMSGLMKKADKAAENADPKGITQVSLISMGILGGLFALLIVFAYLGGNAASGVLQNINENYSWIMGGLSAAGTMMRFVGFGVLMKFMLADSSLWGYLFIGFILANTFQNIEALSGATMILVSIVGVAFAINDYNSKTSLKKELENFEGNGGMSNGI